MNGSTDCERGRFASRWVCGLAMIAAYTSASAMAGTPERGPFQDSALDRVPLLVQQLETPAGPEGVVPESDAAPAATTPPEQATMGTSSASEGGPVTEILAPPPTQVVRGRVFAWAEARRGQMAPGDWTQLEQLWPATLTDSLPGAELLERVANSAAVIHPGVRTFVSQCRQVGPGLTPPDLSTLEDGSVDGWVLLQLQLYQARSLTDWRWFDEALLTLERTPPEQVVDPATRLFCEAVCAQGLLDFGRTSTVLNRLKEGTQQVPQRYQAVAALMLAEIEQVEQKDLHRIARRMSDSERRLTLGRAGQQVQDVQDHIIADLDELIKKIEAQQSGGGGGGGSGNGQSGNSSGENAAQDSTVKGATAPGETDTKKFSKKGNWGNLPEKEQAQARNLINRNFPSHYGKAIEKYFEKLANRTVETAP